MSHLDTGAAGECNKEHDEQLETCLQITDDDIEQALADTGVAIDGEEEELYFDAISTDTKNDDSAIYEDVDGNDNKQPDDKDFEIINPEIPFGIKHRYEQDEVDNKHQREKDEAVHHLSAGIYDTPRKLNVPACVSPSLNDSASDQVNQFELAKEQENACLTNLGNINTKTANVKTGNTLHGVSSPDLLEFSKNEQISEPNSLIYDLAQNVSQHPKVDSGDHSTVYELAQNVNKQDTVCGETITTTGVENSVSVNSEQAKHSAPVYELAQKITSDIEPEKPTNEPSVNLRSKSYHEAISDDQNVAKSASKETARKNQYDPAWTDSIFDKIPVDILKPIIAENHGNLEPGLKIEKETKEEKKKEPEEMVEHRFMSESGNYDRLVLRDSVARKNMHERSSYGVVINEDIMLQTGGNTLDSKGSGSSSRSGTLESSRGKSRTHTRRRRGTKGRTLNRTGTHDLTGTEDITETKSRTLNRTGTQDLTGADNRRFDIDAVYTDVNEDDGTLMRDDEIYEPIGEDFDSDEFDDDDDGWSSSEFEEYMDQPQHESEGAPDKPLPPPPSKGGAKPEKTKFIQRISSFRSKGEDVEEEDGPCLPLTINQTKHPPPELPKTPPHLSQIQVKKRLVIGCVIDSERSYIESLERVTKEYKEPLLVTHGLKGTKVSIVMKKIEEIARHHKMFQIELAEKVKKWDEKEEIGGIFAASFSRSMVVDVYSVYVNNFSAAMEEIKALQSTRPALKEFLKTAEAKHADRLSIFGLMVKPVQRFPQFIMFMQDLLKYTPQNHHDRSNLQRALTDLENVTYRLNERKRETEQNFQAIQLLKCLNFRTVMDKTPRLLRQDDLNQSESVNGQVKTKTRRVYLLDKTLIGVTVLQREQDGRSVERLKPKMTVGISELELKESAITPEMKSIIKSDNSKFSIQSKLIDKTEEDLFHLNADLSHMLHDYTVLGQIQQLLSSLKCSYQGLSEDSVHETICDLQKKIQVKDQQLQLLNSCSIMLHDVNRNVRYIFQTSTPELKEEWCKDFLLAKLALDPLNKPSWDMSHNSSDEEDVVIHQPCMFMKWLSVDMPRYYTKMICAVPVFLSSALPSEIGIQHLWVVMTAEKRTQVALVSTQSAKPALMESFKATESEVVAVETVPGYAIMEAENSFIEDTVWMSTTNSEILVFSLFDEDGRRQSTTAREPRIKFNCIGVAMVMRYTEDRMFVGLTNGIIVIYDRNYEDGIWNIDSPSIIQLGSARVSSIIILEEDVWVSCGASVYIIPMEESAYQEVIDMKCGDDSEISDMVKSGVGLWVSYKDKSLLHLYHVETKQQLQEINVASAIERITTGTSAGVSENFNKKCVVTSLMASRGFLWVGTNFGIVLNFQLPRLRDGVPLIHGRANVCYHSHNGPVKFLIPIYCGTVNTWDRAKALEISTSMREEKSNAQKEKKKDKTEQDKRHSVNFEVVLSPENKEKVFAGKSTPLDIPLLNKKRKENNESSSTKSSESDELLGGSYEVVYGIKRFRSLENLDTDNKQNFKDIRNSCINTIAKNKTLTLRRELAQKLQARQNGTASENTSEREISLYYGDLLHDNVDSPESVKSDPQSRNTADFKTDSEQMGKIDDKKSVKVYRHQPVEIPIASSMKYESLPGKADSAAGSSKLSQSPDKPEKSKIANVRKSLSFQFKNLKKSSQGLYKSASLRVNSSANPRSTTLNTIQRRNCNAVVVVSGGDGYTDWRVPLKETPKHNDASLMFWMYKF